MQQNNNFIPALIELLKYFFVESYLPFVEPKVQYVIYVWQKTCKKAE
jgi:phenylalanyl-tRNA synthetase alpha subunit